MADISSNGWRSVFFVLLAFVAGNGVNYLVNGLDHVTRLDYEKGQSATQVRLDQQAQTLNDLRDQIIGLVAQLRARKEIDGP